MPFRSTQSERSVDLAVLAGFCLLIPGALCQEQAKKHEKIPMTVDRWTLTAADEVEAGVNLFCVEWQS
jgi:hypothetical protein